MAKPTGEVIVAKSFEETTYLLSVAVEVAEVDGHEDIERVADLLRLSNSRKEVGRLTMVDVAAGSEGVRGQGLSLSCAVSTT